MPTLTLSPSTHPARLNRYPRISDAGGIGDPDLRGELATPIERAEHEFDNTKQHQDECAEFEYQPLPWASVNLAT